METESSYTRFSHGFGALVVLVALVLGAAGGYAIRGADVRGAQAAPAAGIEHPALVPRSAREDDATSIQAPALIPRSAREDAIVPAADHPALIPRSAREDDVPPAK